MVKTITLDNGLRIVCENIPYVRSVSVGVWIGTGSEKETEFNNGISHFIEHMLFKGTQKRSAREIAETFDNIGGQINAFTSKEYTCYFTKTLDSHLDISLEILSDMLFNSTYNEKDIELEKSVINEEISIGEDSAEDLVHELIQKECWKGNTLGYPIIGKKECLDNFTKEEILKYKKENYTPYNCVISVVGRFDLDNLVYLISKYFIEWKSENKEIKLNEICNFDKSYKLKNKETEQVNICLAFEGIEMGNEKLYPLMVVNNIIGGGMSSRLFQKIREDQGLVYSIYSYSVAYKRAGLVTIYACMHPNNLNKVNDLILSEIDYVVKNGLTKEQIHKAKEQLKGNFILGLESTSGRMTSIGKSELLLNRIYSQETVMDNIDRITNDSVMEVIEQVFNNNKISFAAVGNLIGNVDIEKTLFS